MKQILIALLAFAAAFAVAAAPKDKAQGPKIEFAQKSHDFGNIREADGTAHCEFEFTNVGDQPLMIIAAYASCGCTKPEYPTKPIAPGKKGKIKVNFNPANRPGEFTKTVTVRTNAPKNKKTSLRISGFVQPKE